MNNPAHPCTKRVTDIKPFKGEEIIGIKNVPRLTDLFLRPPTKETVLAWHTRGIWVARLKERFHLRARREGGEYVTSVEAVVEFLEAINR